MFLQNTSLTLDRNGFRENKLRYFFEIEGVDLRVFALLASQMLAPGFRIPSRFDY